MFNNVGKKVKIIAGVIFVLGVISSIILAISNFIQAGLVKEALEDYTIRNEFFKNLTQEELELEKSSLNIAGVLYLILGPIITSAISYVIYAIGYTADMVSFTPTRTFRASSTQKNTSNEKPSIFASPVKTTTPTPVKTTTPTPVKVYPPVDLDPTPKSGATPKKSYSNIQVYDYYAAPYIPDKEEQLRLLSKVLKSGDITYDEYQKYEKLVEKNKIYLVEN